MCVFHPRSNRWRCSRAAPLGSPRHQEGGPLSGEGHLHSRRSSWRGTSVRPPPARLTSRRRCSSSTLQEVVSVPLCFAYTNPGEFKHLIEFKPWWTMLETCLDYSPDLPCPRFSIRLGIGIWPFDTRVYCLQAQISVSEHRATDFSFGVRAGGASSVQLLVRQLDLGGTPSAAASDASASYSVRCRPCSRPPYYYKSKLHHPGCRELGFRTAPGSLYLWDVEYLCTLTLNITCVAPGPGPVRLVAVCASLLACLGSMLASTRFCDNHICLLGSCKFKCTLCVCVRTKGSTLSFPALNPCTCQCPGGGIPAHSPPGC